MAKYQTLVEFSDKNLGPREIADYYNDTDSSIRFFYTTRPSAKFFGYTGDQAIAEMESRVAELDVTCTFTLLADLEATFKIDYLQRCYQKKRDPISRSFRQTYKQKGASISLGRDILPIWRSCKPELRFLIGTILGAFNYRDWIAHGRYWTPALGQKYDFLTVFQIDLAARSNFPFMSN